jgi:hypothetical protein
LGKGEVLPLDRSLLMGDFSVSVCTFSENGRDRMACPSW